MTFCPCTSKRPKDTILCINRITWCLAFSIWWLEHVVLKKISSSSVYIDHVKNKCEKKKHQHSMIVRTWLVDRIDSICIATPPQSIIWTSFGKKRQGIVLCLYQKKKRERKKCQDGSISQADTEWSDASIVMYHRQRHLNHQTPQKLRRYLIVSKNHRSYVLLTLEPINW